MSNSDKPVTLAAIAGAHGVTGEVRLKLFGEGVATLKQHKSFNEGTLTLKSLRDDGKGGAIARFAEVADRNAAEALRSTTLTVPRSALPPLEEGEYYHADLIGLAAVDRDGAAIGIVVGVENYGAGDLLEIEDGEGRRSLIPFRNGIADLENGRIVLDAEFLA
jgi:16S rRNA processing protein RimM